MKKLLGCFLCLMLMVFLAAPAAADTLVLDFDGPTTGAYWVGNDTNGIDLFNSSIAAEETWLNALTGSTVDLVYKDENSSDGWTPPADWTYAVLKYGNGQKPNGYEHWAIMDDGDGILELGDVNLTYHALSHISYDSSPVPEPTTMLLLGGGLVGLAGFGRKKFKK